MNALLALLLVSCKEKEDTVAPRPWSDCDPISYEYCAVPFPSTYFMKEDSTSPTGWRVDLRAKTLPYTDQGEISFQPKPDLWNERDGFSPMGPLLVEFPGMVLDGVPDHDHIGDSLLDTSPFALIDAETGERMPVWAELDISDPNGKQMLLIYPAVPMRNSHRYVMGIRQLKDGSGKTIAASEGYTALRDNVATDNWDIEGRRDHYEQIFSVLEGAGWSRGETQLAWDLVIGSAEGIGGKALFMEKDALARVGSTGPAYTITEINDEFNESIYRRIRGTFSAPLYTEEDNSGTLLTRDENGMPYYNGETEVPFTILIPRTAYENPRPLPMIQYGHGLLGSQGEVESGYLGEMANRYGFVLFATDWTGMKSSDYDAVVETILTKIDNFAVLPERSQQGFTEFAVAAAMMRGNMALDEAVKFPTSDGTMVSSLDPNTLYYYGNSQGGILGASYLALSTTIERGVLGVPGMPYALLLYRSADFSPFFILFKSVYDDSRDIALWMVLMQTLWDSGEGAGYARQMNEEPLDGVPAHQVLLQDALGDAQVTNLGAQNMARAYGAVQLDPPVREVWGVSVVAGPSNASVLSEFDFGAPAVPFENTPPNKDFDTHEDTRRALSAQDQLWHFLTTGEVVNYCDGVCDPE